MLLSEPGDNSNWRIFMLMDAQGEPLLHLLCDRHPSKLPLAAACHAQGWGFIEVAKGEEAQEYCLKSGKGLCATASFWSCDCEQAWLHHAEDGRCPRCGMRPEQDSGRLQRFEELLAKMGRGLARTDSDACLGPWQS